MKQASLDNEPEWMGATATADPFSLVAVQNSKKFEAQKVVIYGVPGVGKSTLASTFPNPIFLRTEDGAGALDVPTFPKIIETLQELDKAISALKDGQHDFKTLVIDSLDWLEPILWQYVCQQNGKRNIEDFGYGKGYTILDDVWRRVQGKLEKLRVSKGMNIVSIAHAAAVTFEPPDSDGYQMYSLKLHKRAAAIWTEWADMILFCNFKANVIAGQNGGKNKAYGDGGRVIYTSQRPAFVAKTRWPLPAEIYIGTDPSWAPFHEAFSTVTDGAWNV